MPKKTEPKDTQSTQPEQVQQVRISDIHPFKNHPFKVVDDALMQETVDSIMQFGVLNPTIIRPDPGGGYEMVAGHRRLHASGLAGKDTIPAIVRNLTDDEAVILLVDTNLQRENISPMERAQAYKMKMEALKHQGQRTDLTLVQVGPKLNSAEKIAQDSGESVSQVKRLNTIEIWKRFRKWGGMPTGITQNVKDLLSSREVENIFENSDYIYMLNQASGDRQILAKQLNISPHQLSYVTHSGEGEGLLFYGNIILPFVDRFPKDTELYRVLTTKPQEVSS